MNDIPNNPRDQKLLAHAGRYAVAVGCLFSMVIIFGISSICILLPGVKPEWVAWAIIIAILPLSLFRIYRQKLHEQGDPLSEQQIIEKRVRGIEKLRVYAFVLGLSAVLFFVLLVKLV